jgi:hypothetical protein
VLLHPSEIGPGTERTRPGAAEATAPPGTTMGDDGNREKLVDLAPGRLSALVTHGLRGHHLLFDHSLILEAFAAPDASVAPEDADAVGAVLLTISQSPLGVARHAVAALPHRARLSLVRLYFRILDRAQEEQPLRH